MGLHRSKIRVNTQIRCGCRQPTDVMRSRKVWARSECYVTISDAGLDQRQSQRVRGVFPKAERAIRCSFLGNGLGDRAAILEVFKPVRLEG